MIFNNGNVRINALVSFQLLHIRCTRFLLYLFFFFGVLTFLEWLAMLSLGFVWWKLREEKEGKRIENHAFFDNHAIFYMCLKMGREGEKNRENLLLFSLFGLQREDKWKEKWYLLLLYPYEVNRIKELSIVVKKKKKKKITNHIMNWFLIFLFRIVLW